MYKRTKHDSKQKCPYCKAQFRMTIDRFIAIYKDGYCQAKCNNCKGIFEINTKWEGQNIHE